MERVNKLLFHNEYQKHLNIIREAEKEREYCGHDLDHFMDVARLSWIECLENQLLYNREVVYAAALMHDIGRSLEYTKGISHDKASVMLCEEILGECGFSDSEIRVIQNAIENHRQSSKKADPGIVNKLCEDTTDDLMETMEDSKNTLGDLLYYADHKSRRCFGCAAESTCYWPKEKKNLSIVR